MLVNKLKAAPAFGKAGCCKGPKTSKLKKSLFLSNCLVSAVNKRLNQSSIKGRVSHSVSSSDPEHFFFLSHSVNISSTSHEYTAYLEKGKKK